MEKLTIKKMYSFTGKEPANEYEVIQGPDDDFIDHSGDWYSASDVDARIAELEAERDHLRETLTGRPSKELYEACMTESEERGKILDAVCRITGAEDYSQLLELREAMQKIVNLYENPSGVLIDGAEMGLIAKAALRREG